MNYIKYNYLVSNYLSVRTISCLHRNKIYNINDLMKLTLVELRYMRNLGRKSFKECIRLIIAIAKENNK